jgi:hypothetical protein
VASESPETRFHFCVNLDQTSRPSLPDNPAYADKLGVDVSTMYADKEIKKLVKDFRRKQFRGKTILTCWHHGQLPKFNPGTGVCTAIRPMA